MKRIRRIFIDIIKAWNSCDPFTTGAALSYYLLFSLPTALIVAVMVSGILVSPNLVETRLIGELNILFGPQAASAVQVLIDESQFSYAGIIASIFGLVALLWGSLGAFGQIQTSLKKIWNIPIDKKSPFLSLIKERIAAFLMVVMLGFLLAASFLASAIVSLFGEYLTLIIPNIHPLIDVANFLLSLILIIFMFVLIYIALPGLKIHWHVAILGGTITSILFMAGKLLLSLYLNSGVKFTGYGAVSVVTILLLWAFLSAQVFLFGAAITYVIDRKYKRA